VGRTDGRGRRQTCRRGDEGSWSWDVVNDRRKLDRRATKGSDRGESTFITEISIGLRARKVKELAKERRRRGTYLGGKRRQPETIGGFAPGGGARKRSHALPKRLGGAFGQVTAGSTPEDKNGSGEELLATSKYEKELVGGGCG